MSKKKVKVNNNAKNPKDSKQKLLIGGAVIALVLVLSFIFFTYESMQKNKLNIANNTSKDITKLELLFSSDEVDYTSEVFFDDAIKAGEEFSGKFPDFPLAYTNSGLIIKLYMEGEEGVMIDAGLFNTNFSGKLSLEFTEDSDGEITMSVVAKEGILGEAYCDEEHVIDFK